MGSPLRGARALFVLTTLELGGAERQALLLARYLKETKHADVSVLAFGAKPGRVARECEERGIPWKIVPLEWTPGRMGTLLRLVRVARYLRGERPDLVLPYHSLANILCGVTWRLTGARVCIWNLRNAGYDLRQGRVERLAMCLTSRFHSNSVHGKDFLVNHLGVPQNRIVVVPNGVDPSPPVSGRAEWRRRLAISDGDLVAGMVGNLHGIKDHATLLRAWGRVEHAARRAGHSPPRLLLAGRFDGRETELKALAFDLALGDTIRFLGPVDDVAGFLQACDLLVHSSRTEGLPNAVLEAMAAGLPVVATDLPGVREAVGEEGLPYLAPPDDPAAFAERVWEITNDPRVRRELGAAMRARARRCFDAAANCERVCACLESELTQA